ncbi:peptidase M23 [Intrasporangium oryzae NRRL B-24470]|uniref:Peptidase M23 n=1 Tax=Intrasporangium oryzae NRRL B-24470 TaxID=1386089 RepID=W9GB23_9MICO|nr:M23 family metallopeptidase [Intrasporangium oryzae]EWT03406.1 peptidase M23 [Intrasporangium oryzae NRRL B-24470]
MQDPKPHDDGPVIVHVRMTGRLVPFAAGVVVFAFLPSLVASPHGPEARQVVLEADSVAIPAAFGGPASAVPGQSTVADGPAAATEGAAMGAAVGGGFFLFPDVSFTPAPFGSVTPTTVPAALGPLYAGFAFIHPVPGGEVSPFGPRIHPVLGRPMFHTGIDLMAACGTPIRAAADGTVIYARQSASWGLRTIIQHTPGLKTAYGHQSKFLVKEGDVVKQGQVIGLVGTTGWSTGCHLHFDVIVNDRYTDPAPYLGFPASRADSIPFAAAPAYVVDRGGTVVHTVEDGDVPVPNYDPTGPTAGTSIPGTPTPAPTSTTPTSSPTSTTSQPTTSMTSTPPATTTTTPPPTSTTTAPPPTSTGSTTTSTTPATTATTTATTTQATSAPATTTAGSTAAAEPSTSTTSVATPSDTTTTTTSGSTAAAEPTTSTTTAP